MVPIIAQNLTHWTYENSDFAKIQEHERGLKKNHIGIYDMTQSVKDFY